MLRELRNQMDEYLTGQSSIQQLESWLLSNLQTIIDSGDDVANELANNIDADLIQFSENILDEATIKERVKDYAQMSRTVYVTSHDPAPAVATLTTIAPATRTISWAPSPV